MLGRIGRWLLKRGYASQRETEQRERAAKRVELRAQPFPDAWRSYLGVLPYVRRLTAEQRAKWHGDIQVFVGEKRFIGMDGFVVDDRVKVLVGAAASLLVLGRDISVFDHVERILIYEELEEQNVGGLYQQQQRVLGDEVIDAIGVVELGWKHVAHGFRRAEGHNTALHEFAHAFDDADGKLDALMSHAHYERWRTLLHQLPLHYRREGDMLYTDIIADAEGPELFAVATELFFERPQKLYDLDRDLFEAMREIYAIDPRQLTTP